MTPKQFDQNVRKLFGPVLEPYGFSTERSQYSTYHRKSKSGDVYHFILPDLGSRGVWYDVKVFASSPLLDPLFPAQFPDEVGIPSDSFCYLSERGVGLDQQHFNCKSDENFVARFENTVRDVLLSKAVPYLDRIDTLEDMLPTIRNPLFLGIVLHRIGRVVEARPLLESLSRLR